MHVVGVAQLLTSLFFFPSVDTVRLILLNYLTYCVVECALSAGSGAAGGGAVAGAHFRGGLAALRADVHRHQEEPQGHARPQGILITN